MLEDHLAPNEVIVFRQPQEVEFKNEVYDELAITSQRIIFYKRTGLLFKKDNSSSIGLSNIGGVKFHEKGVVRKKGVMEVHLKNDNPLQIEGNASEMKYLYQNLLSRIQ
ncbi:MAG: hypothetical protein ACREBB_11795 [Nitrosotalea sp.]